MTRDLVDMPEGTIWRKVRMSQTLFELLGAGGVDWGEPDDEGFYTPTVYLGADGMPTRSQPLRGPKYWWRSGDR